MMKFTKSLRDWPSARFQETLQAELLTKRPNDLLLQHATQQGGLVDDTRLEPSVLAIREEQGAILARVGVFFNEIVAGCNCGDDPVTVNSYCELELRINRQTGEAEVSLISR